MITLDLLEMQAREKLGMPPGWTVYRRECFPHGGPTMYFAVTGAVCTVFYKSGKRKGRLNWSKAERSTERTVNIQVVEHEAYIAAWEQRTGFCAGCGGDGQEWAGWSKDEGTKTRQCRKCAGTGKARAAKDGAA